MEKFTYNDFILVPDYASSTTDTRESDSCSSAILFGTKIKVPIISTPMDTITESLMMRSMLFSGGSGVHHRGCDFKKIEEAIEIVNNGGFAVCPSMDFDRIIALGNKYPESYCVVDVAHGDSEKIYDFCKNLILSGVRNIVSGNIVTKHAAEHYLSIGVNYLRVGMGNGSKCTTRTVTGFGYPQASAISEIHEEFGDAAFIVADGGMNSTGDVIKAFSCGASFAMSGYLFAGTQECPKVDGESVYRGMASGEALELRKKQYFKEGVSVVVKEKGYAFEVVDEVAKAIQHACYYGGVSHYKELTQIRKVFITEQSYFEGLTRL